MSFFALAGFDVEQILKAIGPTLNPAAAGQLEIAQAAVIAAKIMAGTTLRGAICCPADSRTENTCPSEKSYAGRTGRPCSAG